jgi:hypothetical protein
MAQRYLKFLKFCFFGKIQVCVGEIQLPLVRYGTHYRLLAVYKQKYNYSDKHQLKNKNYNPIEFSQQIGVKDNLKSISIQQRNNPK